MDYIRNVIEWFQDIAAKVNDNVWKIVFACIILIIILLFVVGKSYSAETMMVYENAKSHTTQYMELHSGDCKNPAVLKTVEMFTSSGLPVPSSLSSAKGTYQGVNAEACWTIIGNYVVVFWDDQSYTLFKPSDFHEPKRI